MQMYTVLTQEKHYLCKQVANLLGFQKSTYHAGIKIFNNLISDLKILMNEKAKLKIAQNRYLNTHNHSTMMMNTYCLKNHSSI
jgi:hypothetical protein